MMLQDPNMGLTDVPAMPAGWGWALASSGAESQRRDHGDDVDEVAEQVTGIWSLGIRRHAHELPTPGARVEIC